MDNENKFQKSHIIADQDFLLTTLNAGMLCCVIEKEKKTFTL